MNPSRAACFALMLVAFSFATANSAGAQIVALGASNTQGRGVSPQQAWPALLESMLRARGRDVQVVNAGISGDTTGGMQARLGSSVPEGTRLVILDFGRNDFKRGRRGGGFIGPEARQANIAEIEQELRKRGIRTIDAGGMINSIRAAGMVQVDGIHLTAAGHQKVASRLVGLVR